MSDCLFMVIACVFLRVSCIIILILDTKDMPTQDIIPKNIILKDESKGKDGKSDENNF